MNTKDARAIRDARKQTREAERQNTRDAYDALNEARVSLGLPTAHVPRHYALSIEEMEARGMHVVRGPKLEN